MIRGGSQLLCWVLRRRGASTATGLRTISSASNDNAGSYQSYWNYAVIPGAALAFSVGQALCAEQKPANAVHIPLQDGSRVIVIADPQIPADTEGVAQPAPLPGKFQLPALPYSLAALEPAMSRATLEFHWGKHHRAYIDNLNKQIAGTALESKTLEEVIKETWKGGKPDPEFNNAAQAWNHAFFWQCMKAGGGGAPAGPLAEAITRDFGSLEELKARFKAYAAGQFGSGWAWLVADEQGKLKLMRTPNAGTPLTYPGLTPLLTCDVWEHAYYLDYQNKRPDYLSAFMDKLVDWGAAQHRYEALLKKL